MALLNRRIFVQYDVPGPVLWHERLVLRHVRDQEYAPDRDVYVEELGLGNAGLQLPVTPRRVVLPSASI